MENENIQQTPPQPIVQNPYFQPFLMTVPNSTGVLVTGILSIVFSVCCYGMPISITLGIIALVLFSTGNTVYKNDPNKYTIESFNNMKSGKICAIIGLSINMLWLLFCVAMIAIRGFSTMDYPFNY